MVEKSKGYTLVELTVVLSIIGIISVLVVPNLFRNSEKWILRSTAYMMAKEIRNVQNMSITECDRYQFELHTKKFYYQIKNYRANAAPIKRIELDPCITEVTSTLYNPNFKGELDGYRILLFTETGTPNQAGRVTLKSKSGHSIEFTVELATGRVRVFD